MTILPHIDYSRKLWLFKHTMTTHAHRGSSSTPWLFKHTIDYSSTPWLFKHTMIIRAHWLLEHTTNITWLWSTLLISLLEHTATIQANYDYSSKLYYSSTLTYPSTLTIRVHYEYDYWITLWVFEQFFRTEGWTKAGAFQHHARQHSTTSTAAHVIRTSSSLLSRGAKTDPGTTNITQGSTTVYPWLGHRGHTPRGTRDGFVRRSSQTWAFTKFSIALIGHITI